jgi:peptidoglycan hydrolase-like protein with peptidoglycan-binding domain
MKRLIPIGVVILIIGAAILLFGSSSSDLSATPDACVHSVLAPGASGHCVADLQTMLNWSLFGIDGPNYKPVNGQYSAVTTTLLARFQSSVSLPATGTLTTQSWQKLCAAGNDAPATWRSAAKDAGCRL